jgi:disulfide bond formation protein DsbB
MLARLLDPRIACAAAALAAIAVLGGAFFFQYVVGLPPCPLCLQQRWPYAAVIVLGAVGALPIAGPGLARALLGLCGIAFAVTCGIGIYHAGVEYGWFRGPETCTGVGVGGDTVEALRRSLQAAPVVRCDDVPWSLFGVSLAGYNALIAACLAAACLATALKPPRARRDP